MTGNILRLMLSRGLSMVRWNNFPRVVDVTQMDNVGATLHTALFLVSLEESKNETSSPLAGENGERYGELDRLYIIKKIMFSSFSEFILSDINSGTKNTIKKLDSEMFEALYGKAYRYFLNFDMPEPLRKDYENIMFGEKKEKEDRIIYAAKKYVGYNEALPNARIFPDMYEIYISEMESELDILASQLHSLTLLRNNPSFQKYLSHIYRLSSSLRWNQYSRKTPISVMSHTVVISYITYVIGMMEEDYSDTMLLEMLLRAVYHDVPEVITGDIISPTKKAVGGLAELLEKVEAYMLDEYLFEYIDESYKNFLKPYLLEPFEGKIGKKVKYADIISAYLEAKIEAPYSQVFSLKEQDLRKQVQVMHHPGVEYLLREILFEFEKSEDDSLV
ncbi:HD domain-containing protein [Candidatus Gracilibacteria bacterium]|nr:HD domain-containing protein [Candidatus Gracilibacteria bacterium]